MVNTSRLKQWLKYGLTSALFCLSVACTSQVDQIITTQTKLLEEDPTNVTALINRGNAYREKNQLDLALADHNQAIALAPSSPTAYLARGKDYLKTKQFDKALKDFSLALEFNPSSAEAYARRGEARARMEDNFTIALSDLNRGIELGFNHQDAFSSRGFVLFKTGDQEGALKDYLKANQLAPSNVELLTEAIDLGLKNATLYLKRGQAHKINHSFQNAIDDFSQALRLNPSNSNILEERADAYYQKGDCDEAEEDLQNACELDDREMCSVIQLTCSSEAQKDDQEKEAEDSVDIVEVELED